MANKRKYLGTFSNFIGGMGYISVTTQWIWSSLPLLYPLTQNDTFKTYFMPTPQSAAPVEQVPPTMLSSGLEIALIVFAVVFAIGIIVYIIFAVPRSFGRGGNVVTKKSAEVIIPVITSQKKITIVERRTLISRISWGIKALLVAVPLFLLFVDVPEIFNLTQNQFAAAGIAAAFGSTLLFLMQFILAKLAKLPGEKIW